MNAPLFFLRSNIINALSVTLHRGSEQTLKLTDKELTLLSFYLKECQCHNSGILWVVLVAGGSSRSTDNVEQSRNFRHNFTYCQGAWMSETKPKGSNPQKHLQIGLAIMLFYNEFKRIVFSRVYRQYGLNNIHAVHNVRKKTFLQFCNLTCQHVGSRNKLWTQTDISPSKLQYGNLL